MSNTQGSYPWDNRRMKMILGTNLLDLMGGIVLDNEVIVEPKTVVTLEVAESVKTTIQLLNDTIDTMYQQCKVATNFNEVLEKNKNNIKILNDAIRLKDINIKPEKGYIKGYWNGEQLFYISLGNAKLAPDTYGNGFMIWSIVGKITCNGKTKLCSKNCYNCSRSFEKNIKSKIRNAIFAQMDCFEDVMVKVAKMTPYAKNTYFRIHEDGDFYSTEYTQRWFNIAEKLENEKIKFMAYTKEPSLLTQINTINAQRENVELRFSVMEDTDTDIKAYIKENEVPVYICIGTQKINARSTSKSAKATIKLFNMVNPLNRCVDDCTICKKCYYDGIKTIVTKMHN